MQPHRRFSQRSYLLLFSLLICIAFFHCHRGYTDPYADVPVSHAFARNPPVATQIQISLLAAPTEAGNLLYEATLPKEKIKSDRLAFYIGDSNKIVLHDDGENGDVTAGDGIYSTVMNVSVDSLGTLMQQQLSLGRKLASTKGLLFQFSRRMQFPYDPAPLQRTFTEELMKKDVVSLLKNRFTLFPFDLILPVSETFKKESLTVIDSAVVNDPGRTYNPCTNTGTPGGAWTFGKLMTDLANTPVSGISPADFMLHWLNIWTTDQTVNGDHVSSRAGIDSFMRVWHNLSGGPSAPLDVNKAPFKLLAIVNRFDLRAGGSYGGGDAGEARMIFLAINEQCQPFTGNFFNHFLVIFEFGVNKFNCVAIHDYAKQWVDLSSLPLGSTAYNTALQNITDQFAAANTNMAKPNNSSLDQLRTNEFALAGPWELREFHLSGTTHQLEMSTTARQPVSPLGLLGGPDFPPGDPIGIAAFGNFVNVNAETIIEDKMDLPNQLNVSGTPTNFLAAKAWMEDPLHFHWDATEPSGSGHIVNDTARMHISLNTCNACHSGETQDLTFTQVDMFNGKTHLSAFLTGLQQDRGAPVVYTNSPFIVNDVANRPSAAHPVQWPFNDLERRGRDLIDFTHQPCFILLPDIHLFPAFIPFVISEQLRFSPLTMTH